MKRFFCMILCLLTMFLLGCSGRIDGTTTPAPEEERTEAPAPEEERTEAPASPEEPVTSVGALSFDTVTLYGEPIAAGIIEGYDLVIVNYWAEWCGPCVGELPELERIHQEYPNVLILGVLIGTDGVDLAKATLESAGVTYPTLEPAGSLIGMSTRSQYIPATYFFDGEGSEIGESVVGSQDYEGWKTTVEGLLP